MSGKQNDNRNFLKLSAGDKYNRGLDNLFGRYVEKDIKTAVMWLEAASQSGHAEALLVLGKLYYEGNEISQDLSKAAVYFRRAAIEKSAEASYWLGMAYYEGKGTKQDYANAVQYFQKALPWGDAKLYSVLASCYENGNGVEEDAHQALAYYEKAVQAGDMRSKVKIAEMYAGGIGAGKDEEKAFAILNEVIDSKDEHVYYTLGKYYQQGIGTPKDAVSAFQCFELAAQYGHPEAQVQMGICYFEGDGVYKSEEKATELLIRAAEEGYEQAYFYAGRFYYKGEYVVQDLRLSQYYFERALEAGVEEATGYLELVRTEMKAVREKEDKRKRDELNDMISALSELTSDEKVNRSEAPVPERKPSAERIQQDIQAFRKKYAQLVSDANYGDLEAQYQLAFYYTQGMVMYNQEIFPQDMEKAIYGYEKLAQLGYKDAEEHLKICQELHTRAYAQKILEQTQKVNRELQQKMDAEDRKRQEEKKQKRIKARAALNEFESLKQYAETGNAEAGFLMGMAYLNGQYSDDILIVPVDYDYAMDWFTKAAAQGHKEANEKLTLCVKGKAEALAKQIAKEHEQARKEALQLQEEAKKAEERAREKQEKEARIAALAKKKEFEALEQYAQSGNADGLFFLGQSYYEGVYSGSIEVVPVNIDKAIECFTKALGAGKHEAFEMLADCQAIKAREEKEKQALITAQAMKNEFAALLQFAKDGGADAQYYLGMAYFNGMCTEQEVIVPVDVQKAIECFRIADVGGNKDALQMLVQCNVLLMEEKEEKQARIAARAAQNEFDSLVQYAESGNANAQLILAKQYLEGVKSGRITVVEANPERAEYWLYMSAENGNQEAAAMLGEREEQ